MLIGGNFNTKKSIPDCLRLRYRITYVKMCLFSMCNMTLMQNTFMQIFFFFFYANLPIFSRNYFNGAASTFRCPARFCFSISAIKTESNNLSNLAFIPFHFGSIAEGRLSKNQNVHHFVQDFMYKVSTNMDGRDMNCLFRTWLSRPLTLMQLFLIAANPRGWNEYK